MANQVLAYARSAVDGTADVDPDLFARHVVLDVHPRFARRPARVQRAELADADAWQVDRHLNAAQLLARISRDGAYRIVRGRHMYCAGSPLPRVRPFDDDAIVAILARRSIESCLQWFGVDLYVNTTGRIAYVQVQLWER